MENITKDLVPQSSLVPPSPASSPAYESYRSSGAQNQLVKHQQHDLKHRLWDAEAVLADAAL